MSELSRIEDILKGNEVVPQSRVEVLLKELIEGGGGGSTVTVTPVLQAGVRLATINVDGTDYNIYAPEDVVGSIVTVDPELESGTLLATITVNDAPYYIYAPGSTNSYGYTTPMDSTGSNGDIYGKIENISGEDILIDETIQINGSTSDQVIPIDADVGKYTSFTMTSRISYNGWWSWATQTYNAADIGTSRETATQCAQYHKWYISNGQLIIFNPAGTGDSSAIQISSLIGTYTSAHKVTDIYQKVEGHWSKYEKSGYSETVLWDQSDNPTTSSGDFTLSDSVENYDAIVVIANGAGTVVDYALINTNFIPRGQLRYNVPYLCNASFNNERRPWITFTDSTHITIGLHGSGATILTVVGIKFGDSNSKASINYSTAEQVIGTWIDGKPLYQKTFTVTSPSDGNFARVVDCSSLNIDTMTDITGFIKTTANITKVSNSSFILWYRTKNNDATPNDCIMCQISNGAYYSSNLYITAQYTKTTD